MLNLGRHHLLELKRLCCISGALSPIQVRKETRILQPRFSVYHTRLEQTDRVRDNGVTPEAIVAPPRGPINDRVAPSNQEQLLEC